MNGSNPWPLVATAVALVLVTSLLIAVVAWTAADVEWPVPAHASSPSRSVSRIGAAASQASAMSPPPPYAVAACRRQASQLQDDEFPKPLKTRVAAGPGQDTDDQYREAYARCMRSRGYSN
jgi:hypothetical protein